MRIRFKILFITVALLLTGTGYAQDDDVSEQEQLKLAALEALMAAPPERALPLVTRVLDGNHSDEVKARALFVLSQIDSPEAHARLTGIVRSSSGELQREAIRMVGISGDPASLASLRDLYASGDAEVRGAVLEAYLIADDEDGVYDIAINAQGDEEFSEAVNMLAAMGATDKLRELRNVRGNSVNMIEAYIISGDAGSLRELAADGSDRESQARAIEALGMVGADDIGPTLTGIYRDSDDDRIREAALHGLMIAGDDDALLELYRSASDMAEKRRLFEFISMTGSDKILELVDEALAGGQ